MITKTAREIPFEVVAVRAGEERFQLLRMKPNGFGRPYYSEEVEYYALIDRWGGDICPAGQTEQQARANVASSDWWNKMRSWRMGKAPRPDGLEWWVGRLSCIEPRFLNAYMGEEPKNSIEKRIGSRTVNHPPTADNTPLDALQLVRLGEPMAFLVDSRGMLCFEQGYVGWVRFNFYGADPLAIAGLTTALDSVAEKLGVSWTLQATEYGTQILCQLPPGTAGQDQPLT